MYKEEKKPNITGEFKDTITYTDTGKVEIREGKNVIVDSIAKLITALLKAHAGYSAISYWAIGSGSAGWDISNPPLASVSDVKLVNEFARKAIPTANIVWVDGSNVVSATPTNRLRVTLTFADTDAVGTWREFGLYGGTATTTKDSGILVNHKNHGVLVKTNQMIVERQIVFTFN